MIYDTLNNLPNYLGVSDNLDTVIEYIMARDITTLSAGRTRIDGEKAVVTVSTVTPQSSDKALFQRHDAHIVLETDLEGSELFEVSLAELAHQAHRRSRRHHRGHRRHQHRRDAVRGPVCPVSGRGALQIRPEGPGLRQAEKSRVQH